MKALVITAVFPPEPVVSANLSRDVADELSFENEVTVLCPKPTRPHGFKMEYNFQQNAYRVLRLNSFTCPSSSWIGRLRESYSFGKHCQKYIERNHKNVDTIYANTWPLFAQYLTVSTAQKYEIPLVMHVQDIYPESLSTKMPVLGIILNLLLIPIDKVILGKAKKVIVISEKMKKYLAMSRRIPLNKIMVVKNWQDENAFINFEKAPKVHLSELQLFTFMYMGNIGPVAGIDLLIESFYKANLILKLRQSKKILFANHLNLNVF